ncbi:MAG: coenzyme F420-0:L-glutamate ligase [Parvibaculaceae bacterium]
MDNVPARIDLATRGAALIPVLGLGEVVPGSDLAALLIRALERAAIQLRDGDILVLAQKIVSKSEGRLVELAGIAPSPSAQRLAAMCGKDPRLVELVLRESKEVLRCQRDVLIVEHRSGFIMANAGIDFSNVEQPGPGDELALLLPEDPDASCARLRTELRERLGCTVGVVINDSHGRAFREGTVGVAIGASGLPALNDKRGEFDRHGRRLQSTQVALADEIAAAASLMMGQAGEGRPAVLVRGIEAAGADRPAASLIRPRARDLFRGPRLVDAITQRRSVRRYTATPIPPGLMERLLELSAHAPSAHNRQPWRFAVIAGPEKKSELAHQMAARLRMDRALDGDRPELIEKDAGNSIDRIKGAPAVIVVCLDMSDMDHYPDERRRHAEYQMAVQSTAMAAQNLLLAAYAEGLAGSVMCAPLFCPDVVRACLDLPGSWQPQMLVTLGHAANEGKTLSRKPVGSLTRFF